LPAGGDDGEFPAVMIGDHRHPATLVLFISLLLFECPLISLSFDLYYSCIAAAAYEERDLKKE
jgi:hypothetical protein